MTLYDKMLEAIVNTTDTQFGTSFPYVTGQEQAAIACEKVALQSQANLLSEIAKEMLSKGQSCPEITNRYNKLKAQL